MPDSHVGLVDVSVPFCIELSPAHDGTQSSRELGSQGSAICRKYSRSLQRLFVPFQVSSLEWAAKLAPEGRATLMPRPKKGFP